VVDEVEYRWRASGNDGWIDVTIWPANDVGAAIHAMFDYHHSFETSTAGEHQLVITNRIVRRVIELARAEHAYDPKQRAKDLNLLRVDARVDLTDALRA
jgi:hypothetical protein